jgi:hypothetical protein
MGRRTFRLARDREPDAEYRWGSRFPSIPGCRRCWAGTGISANWRAVADLDTQRSGVTDFTDPIHRGGPALWNGACATSS